MRDYRPIKLARPGSTEAMLQKTYIELGGPKAVVERMAVKRAQAHAYADPDSPQRVAQDQVRALVRAGAREPVHDLAALAGGHFVPGEAVTATVPELAARTAREHGAMLAASIEVMADGEITPREAAALAEHVDSTTRALVSLRNKFAEGL